MFIDPAEVRGIEGKSAIHLARVHGERKRNVFRSDRAVGAGGLHGVGAADGEPIGQTQCILPHAIIESLVTTSSGALAAATEGSTRPVTTRIMHAGLVTVIQYSLSMPRAAEPDRRDL